MDNRTLLVLAFLWQRTDESHIATIADIAAYLTEHGIPGPVKYFSQNCIEESHILLSSPLEFEG